MSEIPAPTARGIGFSMLFPPGWREFRTDAAGEEQLAALASAAARDAGRADIVFLIRQHVHRMFEGLRRRRALGVHLPVEPAHGGTFPVSLTVVPVRVGTQSTLARVAQQLADAAPVERLDVDDTTWYRWEERRDEVDGDGEVISTTWHYVIPRPGGPGEAGLHVLYSLVALAVDRDAEQTRALEALGHGIIGTFRWEAAP